HVFGAVPAFAAAAGIWPGAGPTVRNIAVRAPREAVGRGTRGSIVPPQKYCLTFLASVSNAFHNWHRPPVNPGIAAPRYLIVVGFRLETLYRSPYSGCCGSGGRRNGGTC